MTGREHEALPIDCEEVTRALERGDADAPRSVVERLAEGRGETRVGGLRALRAGPTEDPERLRPVVPALEGLLGDDDDRDAERFPDER